eukprot:COSAG02_NODE_27238_length_614_cov_0.864078_1_plen_69_part_01
MSYPEPARLPAGTSAPPAAAPGAPSDVTYGPDDTPYMYDNDDDYIDEHHYCPNSPSYGACHSLVSATWS